MSIDATSIRFARQRALAGFGNEGQGRVSAARVLVIGAGGLGSAVLPTLAAAGIGAITIVDDDTVDETNLHRQTLYAPADVGSSKAEAAATAMRRLSPDAEISARAMRFDGDSARSLASDVDLIVDASDNAATRYLANDAAAEQGIPLVWGNALGWSGQVGVCWDAHGVDFRDLFPAEPPADGANCETVGVLPSVCTVIGGLMAGEALKLMTGSGEPLLGRVLNFDARDGRVRELSYRRPTGPRRVAVTAPREQGSSEPLRSVSARELRAILAGAERPVLLDVREPWEAEVAQIAGSVLIPLGELASRRDELDPAAATVVYCHHGIRSARALEVLLRSGFSDASHLAGGIDAWSIDVDSAMRRY